MRRGVRVKPSRAAVISVIVALAVGIVLGLRADPGVERALHLFGYPTALVVIVRFVPVVREQRIVWFVAHELAMAAICVGFALDGEWLRIVPNAAWPLIAAVWYRRGGIRRSSL